MIGDPVPVNFPNNRNFVVKSDDPLTRAEELYMAIGNKGGAGGTANNQPTPSPAFVRVSLNAANFSQGGLVDDVDVLVKDVRWCFYDYQGKSDTDALVLGMELEEMSVGADGKRAVHEQYFSAGDKEFFRPSEQAKDGVADGGYLVPIQDRKQLNQNTNAAIFLASLQACQFPVDRLENMSITEALVGAVIHINRVAQPKRQGLIKRTRGGEQGDGGKERESTVVVCTKVVALPGQTQSMTQQAPTSQRPVVQQAQSQPSNAGNGVASAVDEVCKEALGRILMENGGTVNKKDLPTLAFKALMTHPSKKDAIPRLFSDEFLSSVGGVVVDGVPLLITFDGATVRM